MGSIASVMGPRWRGPQQKAMRCWPPGGAAAPQWQRVPTGSITNPAPGVTPAFVSTATCPACFAEPQPGVYRLAVRPSFGTWGGGSYVVLLTVTKPTGTTVEIVVPIDIPF
jgi:hypothetical protein